MRILKVKHKDGKTSIKFERPNKNGQIDEFFVGSHDEPEPAFVVALTMLAMCVREICQMDTAYLDGLSVQGVSYNYTDGGDMGATITALKELETSNAPLVINTPNLSSVDHSKHGDVPILSKTQVQALEDLAYQAQRYIEGSRAQQELNLGQTEEAAEATEIAKDEAAAELDTMYAQAIEIVRETRRASTSAIQRRLKIGYTRAARIMDLMEGAGVVGPSNGSDPREVLIEEAVEA